MENSERQEKILKLRRELKSLEERLKETVSKSGEVSSLGGDGWHDNSAYDLMVAEIDKLWAMMDEIKEEIALLMKETGSS